MSRFQRRPGTAQRMILLRLCRQAASYFPPWVEQEQHHSSRDIFQNLRYLGVAGDGGSEPFEALCERFHWIL